MSSRCRGEDDNSEYSSGTIDPIEKVTRLRAKIIDFQSVDQLRSIIYRDDEAELIHRWHRAIVAYTLSTIDNVGEIPNSIRHDSEVLQQRIKRYKRRTKQCDDEVMGIVLLQDLQMYDTQGKPWVPWLIPLQMYFKLTEDQSYRRQPHL